MIAFNPYQTLNNSGTRASDFVSFEQEKQRMIHQVKIAVQQELGMARVKSAVTTEMGDTIIYDYNTMTYKTSNQERKIKELEKQIEDRKLKKDRDLKNLIAYYYRK